MDSLTRQPMRRGREPTMDLPPGMTCADCVHCNRCTALFGHIPEDESCDWSPSRFRFDAGRAEYLSWFPVASSGSLASDGDHPGYAHIGPQPELVAFKSISEGGLRHEAVPMGTVEAMRRWEALPDGTPLFAHFNAAEASDGGAEIDRDDDGELLIDWSPGPGRMVTLSLRADGRLSYAFTWDGETAHGTAQMPSDTGGNDGR